MEKKDVQKYLEDHYNELTESQKILGKYILDHYGEVAFMSALQIGEKLGLSDATVIRFAKTLGFSGFAEFKNSIGEEIRKRNAPDMKLLKSLKNFNHRDEAITNICKTDIKNLEEYLLNIESSKLDKVVEKVYESETIYFLGLGSSLVVAEFLSFHIRRMGFKINLISEGGIGLFEKLTPMTSKDILIVATFPRYSRDTMNAILFAKKKGVYVITISDSELSDVASESDIVLATQTQIPSFFNSYIVPMELCNIILISILEKNKERIYKNLKKSIEDSEEFNLYI
jgi:DNA-binding MurR/RpiR family transcriptional regulator